VDAAAAAAANASPQPAGGGELTASRSDRETPASTFVRYAVSDASSNRGRALRFHRTY
jgi:hypothetical protein